MKSPFRSGVLFATLTLGLTQAMVAYAGPPSARSGLCSDLFFQSAFLRAPQKGTSLEASAFKAAPQPAADPKSPTMALHRNNPDPVVQELQFLATQPSTPPVGRAYVQSIQDMRMAYLAQDTASFQKANQKMIETAKKILSESGISARTDEGMTLDGTRYTFLKITDSKGDSQYARILKSVMKGKLGLEIKLDPLKIVLDKGPGIYLGSDRSITLSGVDLIQGTSQKVSGTLVHEINHAVFDWKRRNGINSGYHGEIILPRNFGGDTGIPGYPNYMSFEELFTYRADVNNIIKTQNPRSPIAGTTPSLDFVSYVLDMMDKMTQGVARVTTQGRLQIKNNPSAIQFYVSNGSGQMVASIPLKSGDQYIGKTVITLVNSQSKNQAQLLETLDAQLKLSNETAVETAAWIREIKTTKIPLVKNPNDL